MGKGSPRSPDLTLLSPLPLPVDLVSPLTNLEGLGCQRTFPKSRFPGFADTGDGRGGEHRPPKAIPLPAEVAGKFGWSLLLCHPPSHAAAFSL